MLGVRLSKELEERLSNLAKITHRPKSFYVKDALQTYLDEYEEDLKAIADYEKQRREGTLETYSLEEIKKLHNLD